MRRCFCHEELDRPAVFSRTGFPADDPTYDSLKALLAETTELKTIWNGCLHGMPPMQELTEPHSEDFERHITLIQTPLGSLRSSKLVSLKGKPGMPETYFINNRDDAEKYLSIPEPDVGGAVDRFFELDREIDDSGIVDVSLGSTGRNHCGALGSDNLLCSAYTATSSTRFATNR